MRRKLALLLVMLLVLGLFAGCGGGEAEAEAPAEEAPGEETPETPSEEPETSESALGDSDAMVYRALYSGEISSMNYLVESATNEQTVGANVIDTLVEYNSLGELIPGLAESWEPSDDGLSWTFHIREGQKWFDHTGTPVADVTAHDFVAAAKYVCDPKNESGTDYMILDFIEGAEDYYVQMMEDEAADFETVGVKALDDYTLVYTTNDNYPFFPTCLTYVCYMPAYGPLLDELGLDFGTAVDRMYYNGAYIVTEYEPQVNRIYEKNYLNWDADNVHITKFEYTYNPEASTIAPTMILRDEIDSAGISNDIIDEWLANYPEYVSKGRAVPDYSYFYTFNFRPGSGNPERIDIWSDNGWEPENWQLAVSNNNFRHAVMSAFDRDYSMYALEPDPEVRKTVTQHSVTPMTFTGVGGVDFASLPAFDDVHQYFYDLDKAAEYKEKAIEELTEMGVTLPVKMLLSYRSDMSDWEQECVLLKQQIEEALGTDFLVCELYGAPADSFLSNVRRNGMYGFMRCNWGADYEDPSTWAQPFAIDDSVRESDNVVQANSYNDMDYVLLDGVDNDTTEILREYYEKVDEAKGIAETSARLNAFAEAEAMLVENAFVVPYFIYPASYTATRVNIFEGQYAPCGVSNLRFKGQKLYDDFVDMDLYNERYQEWLDKMGVN